MALHWVCLCEVIYGVNIGLVLIVMVRVLYFCVAGLHQQCAQRRTELCSSCRSITRIKKQQHKTVITLPLTVQSSENSPWKAVSSSDTSKPKPWEKAHTNINVWWFCPRYTSLQSSVKVLLHSSCCPWMFPQSTSHAEWPQLRFHDAGHRATPPCISDHCRKQNRNVKNYFFRNFRNVASEYLNATCWCHQTRRIPSSCHEPTVQ